MNEHIESKKKNLGSDEKKRRLVVSILLVISIFPILVVTSLPSLQGEWQGYLLSCFTLLAFLVIAFEINNFLFPYEERENISSILIPALISISTVTFYGLLIFKYISNFQFDYFLLVIYLIVLVSLILITCAFNTISIVNVFILSFLNIFVATFLFFIVHNGLTLYWNILLFPIVIAISVDVSSYFGGKFLGKTKPFGKISPNKTLEGLIIGMIIGGLVGVIWFFGLINPPTFRYQTFYSPELPPGADYNPISSIIRPNVSILLVIISTVFSSLGDLFFSKIKRVYWKKDFSDILGSHGGVLDRIDSHIFSTILFSGVLLLFIN